MGSIPKSYPFLLTSMHHKCGWLHQILQYKVSVCAHASSWHIEFSAVFQGLKQFVLRWSLKHPKSSKWDHWKSWRWGFDAREITNPIFVLCGRWLRIKVRLCLRCRPWIASFTFILRINFWSFQSSKDSKFRFRVFLCLRPCRWWNNFW